MSKRRSKAFSVRVPSANSGFRPVDGGRMLVKCNVTVGQRYKGGRK